MFAASTWVAIAATAAVILFLLLVVESVVLIFVAAFAWRYGKMVLLWEENIGAALDLLDKRYASLANISATPIFRDSPEVRNVMYQIALCRDAVLDIANAMTLPAQTTTVIPHSQFLRPDDEEPLPIVGEQN